MKTKIILYSIIAFLGLVLVFAFKQANTNHKYLYMVSGLKGIVTFDENGKTNRLPYPKDMPISEFVSTKINELSISGYEFKSMSNNGLTGGMDYIFEKE